MILLDTSFLIHIIRQRIQAIKLLSFLENFPIYTTVINIYEIWFGFYKNKSLRENEEYRLKVKTRIEQLLDKVLILNLTESTSKESAKIAGTLIGDGEDIGDKDSLIAGIMIKHGIKAIITDDDYHFKRISGILPIAETIKKKNLRNILDKL